MTRTRKTILALACTGVLTFASSAFAGGSAQLIISSQVTATCKFSTDTYRMPFGPLDPSATANAVQITNIGYLCTAGTPASSIMINGGSSSATVDLVQALGTAILPVHLAWTTPTTAGNGFAPGTAPITFNVTGTIMAADLNAAAAGSYLTRQAITLAP